MTAVNTQRDSSEDLSWVGTFEDLLEVIGTRGPWNIMLFFLTTYACFVSPLLALPYQFLGATPDHWCQVPILGDANWTQHQVLQLAIPNNNDTGQYDPCHMYDYNYSAAAKMGYEAAIKDLPDSTNRTITCPARDFNHTQYQSTVVTEWDLVCSRKALYSTTYSATRAGSLLGALVTGFLFDRYGRRRILLLELLVLILLANLICLAASIEVYITAQFFISFLNTGMYNGCFIILMETCATPYRSAAGALSVIPWALGYMVLPGVAYLVRPWRWLTLTLAMPLLPAISYFWLLPESPRWLIQSNRHTHALTVLHKAATMNGKTLPADHHLLQAMAQITQQEKLKTPEGADETVGLLASVKSSLGLILAPFVHPDLRFRSLVYIMWFNGSLVYFGIALNGTNLSVDLYMYMFLGGLLEIPAYLMLWPTIIYMGRRKTQAVLYLVCGLCILLLTLAMILPQVGSYNVVMALSLTGKLLITAVYQLTWIYTTELFPTKYRSIALSHGQIMATLSSVATPYINDILGTAVVWAPSAIFGCAALVNVVIAIILPETKDCSMPEMSNLTKRNRTQSTETELGVTNSPHVVKVDT